MTELNFPPRGREQHLLPWVLSFLRPHRIRLALLSVLLLFEVALGVLHPWPLAIVLDYVLAERALPSAVAGWVTWVTQGSRVTLLIIVVGAGVVLNLVKQCVTLHAVQLQVWTGQRLV